MEQLSCKPNSIEANNPALSNGVSLVGDVSQLLSNLQSQSQQNLAWLQANMPPYFFITMRRETLAVMNLVNQMHQLGGQSKINIFESDKKLILARLDVPGSLYKTLRDFSGRSISYIEVNHSEKPLPDGKGSLEVQKFLFDLKNPHEIASAGEVSLPPGLEKVVGRAMKSLYPDFDFKRLAEGLALIWCNSPDYVQSSPPERIARLLWLYHQGIRHEGLYLNCEQTKGPQRTAETRLMFAVGNPPQDGFIAQIMEVFHRLDIGVRRLYGLNISNNHHGNFLGTFYVVRHDGKPLKTTSNRFKALKNELYNTQILSSKSRAYQSFVNRGIQTGEDASLTNAFVSFCHTTLAHHDSDRFDRWEVENAFLAHPEITMMLIELFRTRFTPNLKGRPAKYKRALSAATKTIKNFNTGHRSLDQVRREIYSTCLTFINRTLKTNFFVPEKHALAFRLDPSYLSDLASGVTDGLPAAAPFRISFFFSRHGVGYHVGFADIARGGWRTIICRSGDQYTVTTNTLFREVFVLAHTQHLKNKDIYEGGSKLVVAMDATELDDQDAVTQRMYKLQYGFIKAFLDIFTTENGRCKNPQVADYYGDVEAIELGPDENMHDSMIEFIAECSRRRGYVLGIGVMSSKAIGINHKEYGVTSRGVISVAKIAMDQAGINMGKDDFTVKMTGGPLGDVAGNSMKLLLEHSPGVAIVAIIDGSGALYDPQGANKKALQKLLMVHDIDHFDPKALSQGGFLLCRNQVKVESLCTLYKKVVNTGNGIKEEWITSDELQKEMDHLLFKTKADLFLPCGGRPETIDETNVSLLFSVKGAVSCRVIVEGANSFVTPPARDEIQKRGIILIRDATANKCGVISSSYEIIANLLMSDQEFLETKDAYVRDVMNILDKRATDEAKLIFRRHAEAGGARLYTEISSEVSSEINEHQARLFEFFQERPRLLEQELFHKVLLSHLPAFVAKHAKFRSRVDGLPLKIKCAILANEIASFIVYHGEWDSNLEDRLIGYLEPYFG